MGPMANFMSQRKSLAPVRAILADCYNRRVVSANYPRFTALKFAITNASAEMEGYGFKIDFAWLRDPQFLE